MHTVSRSAILQAIAFAFAVAGLSIIVAAHGERVMAGFAAQLPSFEEVQTPYTGGGAVQVEEQHESAPLDPAIAAMTEKQLAYGMLMVLTAFFVHGLFRMRHHNETETGSSDRKKKGVRPAFMMK